MATLADLTPAPDERMLVVGQSGSGKTTLIRKIIEPLAEGEPVIVIDTKPEWVRRRWWEIWRSSDRYQELRSTRPRDIKRLPPGLYVMRPNYPEYSDPRVAQLLIAALRRRGDRIGRNERNITIVVDELHDLQRGTNALPELAKCIKQGRAKHVRLLIGTQRPASVPLIAITEAIKVAAFRLRSADDRQRLAQWVHPALQARPGPGKHDFWFVDGAADSDTAMLIHQGG